MKFRFKHTKKLVNISNKKDEKNFIFVPYKKDRREKKKQFTV